MCLLLFGNVGKGIAIIILVLSISGGGGNYPIQVSGKFFQMINPFLPFTHAVNLLRESAGGIYWPNAWFAIWIMVGISVVLVLAVQFFIHIWNTDRKICGFSTKEPFIPLKTKAENVFSVFGFLFFFIFKATLTKKFWGLLLLTFGNAK